MTEHARELRQELLRSLRKGGWAQSGRMHSRGRFGGDAE